MCKPLICLLSFFLSIQFCPSSRADVIFQIDMDTSIAGVQTSRSAAVGEIFDIGLLMRITDSNTVAGFSLGVNFDTIEADVTLVDTSGRPSGFEQVNAVTIDETTGIVRPFDAISFAAALDSTFPGLIGTLRIQATGPSTDPLVDFLPAFQILGIDGVLDGATGEEVPLGVTPGDGGVFFQGGTLNVTAVPEPSGLVLLAVAMAGFGIRRRRATNN